jgi:hypothetical protein
MRKVLLLVALLLAARPAQAQSEEYKPGPWYGWQLILADATAVGLLFVPVSPAAGPVTRGTGMTAFFMNGPIIHMAHRNPRSASVSLARVPMLLLGRFFGNLAGALLCRESPHCDERSRLLGAGIGASPVLIFDWLTAQRPARSMYAGAPLRLPPPRMEGWALAWPLLGGSF